MPGVMVLEQQLLRDAKTESCRPTKRARLVTAIATETTNTWVELARWSDDITLPV